MPITLPIPALTNSKQPITNGTTILEAYEERTYSYSGGIESASGTAIFLNDATDEVGNFINVAIGASLSSIFQGHPSSGMVTSVDVSTSKEAGIKMVKVTCSSSNEREFDEDSAGSDLRPSLVSKQVTRALEQHPRYKDLWKKDYTLTKDLFIASNAEKEWNDYFGDAPTRTLKVGQLIATIKMGDGVINTIIRSSFSSAQDETLKLFAEWIDLYTSGVSSYIEPQLEMHLSKTFSTLSSARARALPPVGKITSDGVPGYFNSMLKQGESWLVTESSLQPLGARGWKWEYVLTSSNWNPTIYQ